MLFSCSLNYLFYQNNYFVFESPVLIKIIPVLIFMAMLIKLYHFETIKKIKVFKFHLAFFFIFTISSVLHLFFKSSIIEQIHFNFINLLLWSLSIYIIPLIVKTKKDFQYFIKNFSIGLLLIVLFSLLLFFSGIHYDHRLISLFKDPLRVGFIFLFELMIFFNPIFFFIGKTCPRNVISFFLVLISLVLTGSFSAIFSFLFAFVIFLFIFSLKPIKIKVAPLKSIVFVLYCFSIFYLLNIFNIFSNFYNRVIKMFFFNSIESIGFTSINSRINQYFMFVTEFKNMSFFEIFFGKFNYEHYLTLDSLYLQLFYNHGLIGLLTYIFFIGFFFLLNLKLLRTCIHNNVKMPVNVSIYIMGGFSFIIVLLFLSSSLIALMYQFPLNYFIFLYFGSLIALDNVYFRAKV